MILIKTQQEIDLIRESCRIVAETLELMRKHVKPGISTKELDRIAEDHILSRGGKPAFKGYSQAGAYPFPASICASVNEEVVHGIPTNRKLVSGDIISVDVGVQKNGYYGDGATTIAVGEIDAKVRELLEVTERSLYLGLDEAKENNHVQDISFAIQSYVEEHSFSIVRELTGHGVGKFLHESPSVPNFGRKGLGSKLRKGMTIAVEPMVNMGRKEVAFLDDGWTVIAKDRKPSAHFEHTIAINNGKAEILTVL